MMSQREASLLRRLTQGNDADAFSEITRLYAGVVYGTCLRITGNQAQAADAAQETFYHLLKNAGRITGSLGGWLHQVAIRRAIDLVRRDATRRRHESAIAAEANPVETDQWADVSPLVDEAIGELDEELRDTLLRHYLQGQSMVQIAAAKGVSQPTISRRIEQALEQLRGKLRSKGILVSAPALVGLMPNATTSAPAVVLRELGKMALTGSGSAVSGVATTVFSGLEMKLAMVAVVAVLGVGGFLSYQRNRAAESLLVDTASAQPAVEMGNRESTVVPESLPARSFAATPLMAKVASAPRPMMAGEPLVPTAADSTARTQVESESNWGEAVEGVQVRLRAKQTNWNAGAIPRLFVDVRNQGTRRLVIQKRINGCELELDGRWFRRPINSLETRPLPSPFPPGRQYDGIVVNLDRLWELVDSQDVRRSGRTVPERLGLTPGKHTVRVAVTTSADKTEPGKPVRVVSNPVEIEIEAARAATDGSAPAQAESEFTWGEAVEGVQVRLRAPQTNWYSGTTPRFYVDVRNQGTRHLLVRKQLHSCEVELNGTWFRPGNTRAIAARSSPFPPGRQYDGIVINLENYWQEAGEAARRLGRIKRVPDQLTPGKHTVRVAVTATADKTEPGPPVRAVSNPVEIGIGPAQNSAGARK